MQRERTRMPKDLFLWRETHGGTTEKYSDIIAMLDFGVSKFHFLNLLLGRWRWILQFSEVYLGSEQHNQSPTNDSLLIAFSQRRNGDRTVSMCLAVARFLCWTLPILLWDGLRLFALVIALSPGFARFAWYYATCSRKSVRFGHDSCRQTLDVYSAISLNGNSNSNNNNNNEGTNLNIDRQLSSTSASLLQRPVVIFYTGGGWLIGYKMWGALLARALTACNIVVVMPDYRNYPWAVVPDAVKDVEMSLQWTRSHVAVSSIELFT
jgi:hypothetical protein